MARKSKERLLAMIDEGDYWGVLDLKPGADSDTITERVMSLKDEYPNDEDSDLRVALNRVRIALVKEQKNYQNAYSLRNQVLALITAKFGPASYSLCNIAIWKQVWDLGFSRSSDPLIKINILVAEAEQIVARLQPLAIAINEIDLGKATRSVVINQDKACTCCGGKRKIKLYGWEVIDEATKNDQLLHELIENDIPIEAILRQRNTGLYYQTPQLSIEMPCPDCCNDIVFRIPTDVKTGWVLQGQLKGNSSLQFVRVSAITKKTRTASRKQAPFLIDFLVKSGAAVQLLFCFLVMILSYVVTGFMYAMYEPTDRDKKLGQKGLAYWGAIIALGVIIWDLRSMTSGQFDPLQVVVLMLAFGAMSEWFKEGRSPIEG